MKKNEKNRASNIIKDVLHAKNMSIVELANATDRKKQTLYNMLQRDTMTFQTVQELSDALDCDVVLRDRITGKIYD